MLRRLPEAVLPVLSRMAAEDLPETLRQMFIRVIQKLASGELAEAEFLHPMIIVWESFLAGMLRSKWPNL